MNEKDLLLKYKSALEKIANLDPGTDSEDGWNEWGEADCFHQAQEMASRALSND